jgi:hypothetical protein
MPAKKATKKKNSAPSPAQLRARRKFIAMAKARAKAARAAKRAAAQALKPAKRATTPKRATKKAVTKRRNAESRDAQHPIHVRDYWQGRRGYKTQWQRAHEAGQGQLFKVRNPAPAAIKAHIKKLEKERERLKKRTAQEWARLERFGNLWPQYPAGSAMHRGYLASAKKAKSEAQRLEGQARDVERMIERAYKALERSQPHRAQNPGPAAKAKGNFESFRGRPSLKTDVVKAPKGTPKDVAALGQLAKLKLKNGTVLKFGKGPGAPYLAEDNRGKLHIVGGHYRINTGQRRRNPDGAIDMGEIKVIEYYADKQHLTGNGDEVLWYHHLGEEGGQKPHLVVDAEGLGHIEGGDYYIRPEGIRD